MKRDARGGDGGWLRIEIIDVFPTNIGHCPHFNLLNHELRALGGLYCPFTDQAKEYPKHVREAHQRVADVIQRTKNALKDLPLNVSVDMIEATSIKGTLKGIRYRLRKQSGMIVNGRKFIEGYPLPDEFEQRLRLEAQSVLQA